MIQPKDLPTGLGALVVELDDGELAEVTATKTGYYLLSDSFDATAPSAGEMAAKLNGWGAKFVGWA